MPDIASILKAEITRLARKELKPIASNQSKQIQSLKAAVRTLRGQIVALDKSLSKINSIPPATPQKDEDQKDIRITPASIKKHRNRLRLSQAQLGKLLGVSTTTIVFWETGRTSARGANRQNLGKIREMGLRDVKVLLENL